MDGIRSIIGLLLTGPGLACSLGAGCATDDGGNTANAYAPSARTSQFDGGTDARGHAEGSDAEASQAADERDGPLVPRTARLRAEGRGDLSFQAPRDGYVYIVDRRDKKLIYQAPLDEGEEILIAPFRNVIEVDRKRVKRVKDLDNKHIHEIYFERDSDSGRNRRDRDRDRRDR